MLDELAGASVAPQSSGRADARDAASVPAATASVADTLIVERPPAGQTKLMEVGLARVVKFAFPLSDAVVTMLDVDAVFTFPTARRSSFLRCSCGSSIRSR